MYILLIAVFLLLSSLVAAQSPLARRAFDAGNRSAQTGEYAAALKEYRAALIATEDDRGEFAAKLRYNLGVCNYQLGKLRPAVAEFEKAIRLSNGKHRRAFYALGMTHSALENWTAAEKAFLAAIDLEPADGEAWFDLAFVYLAERDYDKAALAFRRSIENRSVDAALGHNNLGVIMAARHDLSAAEKSFEAALTASDGRLTEARTNLELCRRLGGRRELIAMAEFAFTTRRTRV